MQASSIKPRRAFTSDSQPSSDEEKTPETLTPFLASGPACPDPLVLLPGGSVTLSGLGAQPSPRALARCTRPPRRRPPLWPAHPSPRSFALPHLRGCPGLALELVVSGTARGYCRRQGGLRDFGPLGDRELHDQRERCFLLFARSPPAKAPALLHPLGTLLSPPQPVESPGAPRDLARLGPMHCLPRSSAPPARVAPRPGLGSRL